MRSARYHAGGFLPAAPAQNKAEEYDSVAGTYTRWNISGAQIEQRPLSAAEVESFARAQEQQAQESNRATIDAGITAALAKLDQLIAAPAVADVPTGTLTVAQLSTIVRSLRDVTQQNRAGAQDIARVLKQTIRLVRGDFGGVD